MSHVFDTDELIGTQIGSYRIDARIARGGMGVLYRAEHTGLGRTAALKVIAPELADDRDYRQRFEREARTAASIEHPNVVPVWDFAQDGGRLYIAMRFVDGPDLADVVARDGRLAPRRAASIVAQAAAALDAAHARGLVHRDVKPGNILLESRPGVEHAWVTDFGLARAAARSRTGLTRHGVVLGTLDFIAPEQLENRTVDGRADVYALGCVLFFLLAGRVPFPVHTDAQRMKAHMLEPPPGLPVPQLQQAFNPVIVRALAKRPEDRFQHAGELGNAAIEAAGRLPAGTGRAPQSAAHHGAQARVLPGTPPPRTPPPRTPPPRTPPPRTPPPRTPPPRTPPPAQRAPAPSPRTPSSRQDRSRAPHSRAPWVVAGAAVVVVLLAVGALFLSGALGGDGGRDPGPAPDRSEDGTIAGVTEAEAGDVMDQFESSFEAEDSEDLLGLMTPDAVWQIEGDWEDSTQEGIKGTFDAIFDSWTQPEVEWSKVDYTPARGDEPAHMRADWRMSDGDRFDHLWFVEAQFVRFSDNVRISRFVEVSQ